MAGTGNTHEVKEVVEEGMTSEESSVDETKQSTLQMVLQYKKAVLWSAFMSLAAINWGMDVLVGLMQLLINFSLTKFSCRMASSLSHHSKRTSDISLRTSTSSAIAGRLPSTPPRQSVGSSEQLDQDTLQTNWERRCHWGLDASSVSGLSSCRYSLPSQLYFCLGR